MTYLLWQTSLKETLHSGTPKYHLQNGNISSLKLIPFQMEAQSGLRREPQGKKEEERPHKEQKERPHKEEEKSRKLKKMGISPQLTFQLLDGPLNRQLKLEPQQNNDIDITEVTVNASIETTDSLTIKKYGVSRKRREESVEQSKKTDKVRISVPPQLITEAGELKSISIIRTKPLPEIALCGWTHHQTKGEVIRDPKGCDLTLIQEKDEWVLIMNKIEPLEGEEHIVEITRTTVTEGSSSTVIRIDPTPAPEQEEPVTTRTTTTTMVEAAVKTTVATTKITSTALTKQSTVPTKKPETSEPEGFFTDIWNFMINTNNLPREKDNVTPTDALTPELYKDNSLEKLVGNEWYEWAKYTANKHRMDNCIYCSKSPLSDFLIVPELASFEECVKWKMYSEKILPSFV
ncbi:uncharacterized protein LOC129815371 [Salvelinus fontinalis]|uniref:uncharacterized protein LOC129815371 n=1 Tax=Salvelinus fontinalis TaxID=8038 RepID=UPI002486B68E|nr:uncharacterized protein LOC129815371 [Salvelinus fontinalis]XP_055725114.1 uncharacterized protein LOC129815371 [Salvelinus fontinalis]XP_055725115.1 uncharacterized protein LOC129815371 [Salvelinus fontinalis]